MPWSQIIGSVLWLVSGVAWGIPDSLGWVQFLGMADHAKQTHSVRSHAKDIKPPSLQGKVTSKGAITDIVTGEVIMALPSNMLLNMTQSISFSFSNSSLTETATKVSLADNHLPGFVETSRTCGDELLPGAFCQVNGNYTPTALGDAVIELTLSYAEGNSVPLKTHTHVTTVPVMGNITTPLPANISLEDRAPVVFSFTNHGRGPATKIQVSTDYPSDFVEANNTCGMAERPVTLPGGQGCQFTGVLIPTKTRTIGVDIILSYTEGSPVSLHTETTVGNPVSIGGEVATPLPANILLGEHHPVVFSYENHGVQPATHVQVHTHYPSDFVEASNTCGTAEQPATIPGGQGCQISGVLATTKTGLTNIGTTLSYAEGSQISLHTKAMVESDAAISGLVTMPLPVNMLIGESTPVMFSFTNEGTKPAIGVKVNKNYPSGFTEMNNTCGTAEQPVTLLGGQGCQIKGTFKPIKTGPVSVAVTLSYKEGDDVPLHTETTVEHNMVMSGQVTMPLPTNMLLEESKPVMFLFINQGTKPATGVKANKNYPSGFTEMNNTCGTAEQPVTLPGGQGCEIKGTFKPTKTGPVIVAVALSYKEGSDMPLYTGTTVGNNATILGEITTPLPANILLGKTHPVAFSFMNQGTKPATGVKVNKNYPSGFTETNNTCGTAEQPVTLPGGQGCQVSGVLITDPMDLGPIGVGVTLSYAEGSRVPLHTEATVKSDAAISGQVTTPLPTTVFIRDPYPVAFSFTNHGIGPATTVWARTNYPIDFVEVSNTCGTENHPVTLLGEQSCDIKGTFTPTQAGPMSVGATLSYAEGNNVPLDTSTTITIRRPILYVSIADDNGKTSSILRCPLKVDGTAVRCNRIGLKAYTLLGKMVFDTARMLAYIPNFKSDYDAHHLMASCPVNEDGTFGLCKLNNLGITAEEDIYHSIALNATGTLAYVTSLTNGQVFLCPINTDGTFGHCSPTGPEGERFYLFMNITLNPAGTFAYITKGAKGRIHLCSVSKTGALNHCKKLPESVVTNPLIQELRFNAAGTQAYLVSSSNSILLCSVHEDGTVNHCNPTGSGFHAPTYMVLNAEETHAYVIDVPDNAGFTRILLCPVLTDGTLGHCNSAPGLETIYSAYAMTLL
jgi:hypothetical protein